MITSKTSRMQVGVETTSIEQIAAASVRVNEAKADANSVLEIKPDGIYRLEQIQKAAHISRPTLYRWRNGGGLKVVRVGNVVRIRGTDFYEFLSRYGTVGDNGAAGGTL